MQRERLSTIVIEREVVHRISSLNGKPQRAKRGRTGAHRLLIERFGQRRRIDFAILLPDEGASRIHEISAGNLCGVENTCPRLLGIFREL